VSCDRTRELISAYMDGELDEMRQTGVSAHIKDCQECQQMMTDLQRLRLHIAEGARVAAPPGLSERVRATLAREALDEAPLWRRPVVSGFAWRQAAAVLLLCGLSAAGGWMGGMHMARTNDIERELVTAHMRALIQDKPIQVASNNTHNVKPWFAGRVDFSPSVKDLSAAGFELIGGRLDYIDERRVGVVVYRHGKHWIDVYSWPTSSAGTALIDSTVKGYNVVSWIREGVVYWAVSDLNKEELDKFREALR
jgi:anti-sigma factor RsiW